MFKNKNKNKNKNVVVAIALLCSMSIATIANGQEAAEHIHSADAVVSQNFKYNIKTAVTTFVVTTSDASLEFKLEKNTDLLSKGYVGQDNVEIFKGELKGAQGSWARFTRVNGQISGAFFDGEDLFLVKRFSDFQSKVNLNDIRGLQNLQADTYDTSTLLVNAKDIESSGTCALHDDQLIDTQLRSEQEQQNFDYNDYVDDLRGIMSAAASKEIEINLFADVEFVNSSTDSLAEMLSLLNVADGIFSEQIGVQLRLTEATALQANQTLTSNDSLELIRAFRNTGFSNPGVSHLFTGKNLRGSTVGIAYVSSLCRNSSVGVTQKFGARTALIFAHELGHNFGAPHDNQSGSTCSGTGSGFIMNPSINGGGNNFSSCSVTTMQPVIEYATTGNGACIVELAARAPVITSTPNLLVTAGSPYQYDNNQTLDVDGTGPFEYTLDIAPAGMNIDASGTISWTPMVNDIGTNTIQVRVSNATGSDVQIFDLVVAGAVVVPDQDFIDFETSTLSSFIDQDQYGTTEIGSSPYQLRLTGNNWKSVPINYEVTRSTMIRFDFSSLVKGEIHGIQFLNDNRLNKETGFGILGSQNWGRPAMTYNGSGETQTITIPVGEFFQGQFDDLMFIMDNDISGSQADSVFSNVFIFEEGALVPPSPPATPVIDFSTLSIRPHLPIDQDIDGTVELIEEGKGIKLTGNKWQKVILESTGITPTTIIEFEFKTDSIGEIHGLGFLAGDEINRQRTIQVAGTQSHGLIKSSYNGSGAWQAFTVPVGEFLTSPQVELVFIMDNDNGTGANSSFRNIRFIEQ